jgi:adenosylhomocysteine nucleosidase
MNALLGRITACLLALAGALLMPSVAQAQWLDATPRTLVITAFPPEWKALVGAVADPVELHANGLTILTGAIEGHQVVLLQSGVSMVNAAMNTQLALDRFRIRRIVFSGIAGGIDPGLAVGDVVVPQRWNQYLEVALGRKQGESYSARTYPVEDQLPNYGMLFPRDVVVGNATEPASRHRWFPADPDLLALAKTAVAKVELERCLGANPDPAVEEGGTGDCLPHRPQVVIGGNGISGPAFSDNAEYREYLFATFHAQVLDMETAATAQVAYANSVPFIAFRSLSDLAGGDAGPNTERVFGALAARNSALVVRRFLAALPD